MLRKKRRIVFKEQKSLHVMHLILGPIIIMAFFAVVILLAVLLSSCSTIDDDGSDCPAGTSADAIAFGLSDDATRTAQGTTDLAALRTQGFGVFACHTGLHPYISTSTTPNLMYNQLVGYDDVNGVWTYSPLVYWPNGDDGADEYVTFFAYGPHSSAASGCIVDMSRIDEVGDPWLLYQLGGTESDWQTSQTDLVYDFRRDQVRSGVSTRVNFSFKHALASIGDRITISCDESVEERLKGVYEGSTVTLTITGITVDYQLTRKGRLILNNSTQPNWQAVDSEDSKVHRLLTFAPNLVMAQATSTTESTSTTFDSGTGNGIFYIPLETGSSPQQATVTIDYTVTSGAEVVDEGSASATVPLTFVHNPSQSRDLNITFRIPDPPCSGASLASASVGQIICSHGKAHAATSGDLSCKGKKVAMVAYKGDAGGESSPYNHGLAIALQDAASGTAWCTQTAATCLDAQYNSYSTAITDMAGRSANATLTASADHAAALQARSYQYDGSVAAGAHPTGTSRWFLPAMGQWNLMVKAMCGDHGDLTSSNNTYYQSAAFSTLITAAGGSAVASGHYWSATEKSAHDAWYISFQRGLTQGGDKDEGKYVRAVLAF